MTVQLFFFKKKLNDAENDRGEVMNWCL